MTKGAKFPDILPLLVSTYQQGRLVPFLGAGMSAPMLTLWDKFVEKLEHKACLPRHAVKLSLDENDCLPPNNIRVSPDARAQRACTTIQNRDGRAGFLLAVREALKTTSQELPKGTFSLAQIRWPLVISTNYDDLFFYTCRCRRPSEGDQQWSDEMGVQVLGRSARDCKLVISSLSGPFDRQYIWHVQGFLGGQFPNGNFEKDIPDFNNLQDQLVIGHSEYRRVTNRSPDFRRCFTEVFNTRSFLFLGSSLKEEYFLNLFGEVLDLCGPSAVPHFAFTKKGQVDAGFLADQMNITVCEFPEGSNWDELPNWLDCLKEEIQNPKARGTGWLFSIEPSSGAKPDLEIVRGSAPQDSRKNEAVAFVARRNENDLPIPPPPFVDLAGEPHCKFDGHEHIFYYPARGMYAVTAHCRPDDDDSAVEGALHDLLASVTEINPGTTTVHFQFSATSGTVPPIYAFIEVVRAFGEWRAQRQRDHEPPLRLVLYIQSDVELCLTSGRIDIPELLASGLIRFWAVVVSIKGQEPVRRAILCRPDTTVAEVLRDVGVPVDSRSWFVSICPSPRKEPSKKRTADEVRNLKIGQIGIAFGSVLILEYDEQGNPEER